MPSLSELPGNIKQKKLLMALKRLGFVINKKGGNGSHCKVLWPKTQKCIIIPKNLSKNTLRYILIEIEKCSSIPFLEIKKEL